MLYRIIFCHKDSFQFMEVEVVNLLSQLGLSPGALRGETIVVTGAGGGIGYETAHALLWFGANVVIAEISQPNGHRAKVALEKEFGKERALLVTTDVGDETSIMELYKLSVLAFDKVDAVSTMRPLLCWKRLLTCPSISLKADMITPSITCWLGIISRSSTHQ
jgi:hypothetical protein